MTRRSFGFFGLGKARTGVATDSATENVSDSATDSAIHGATDSATDPATSNTDGDQDHQVSTADGRAAASAGQTPEVSPQPRMEQPELEAPDDVDLTREKGMLNLPPVTVRIPEGEGPIHNVELSVAVTGGPDGLEGHIQSAYSAAVSRLKTTLKQTTIIEPQPATAWDSADGFESLQPVILSFRMTFAPSNHRGKPTDKRRVVERKVTLHPDVTLQSRFKAEVSPPLIRVFDGRTNGPDLEIRVTAVRTGDDSGHPDHKPKLRTSSPDLAKKIREWGIPNLQIKVEEMLNRVISQRTSDGHGGWIARAVPRLDLEKEDSERLLACSAKTRKPMQFTVRLSVDGSPAVEFTIQLKPNENAFPGVVGIDLGTAGSCIVINDPSIVDNPAVPREQVICLKKQMARWIKRPTTNPFRGVTESQWLDMLKSVAAAMNLDPAHAISGIEAIIDKAHQSQSGEDRLFELVRQFELAVLQLSGRGRRAVQQSLHEVMQNVFEEFPLTMWNLRAVEFDNDGDMCSHTSSELELLGLSPEVRGEIGFGSAYRHQKWLRSGESDDVVAVKGKVHKGRFIRSPKSGLERTHLRDAPDYAVTLKDGSEVTLCSKDVVSSAYGSLLQTFADCRQTYGLSNGPLNRVVVTYPASLLPEPRDRIVEMLKQHGIRDVNRVFDEAIAPAIFYMEQRFSDAAEIGPEAFKIHCLRIGDVWYHQMLIVDVGAGTTDIALVQIEMRETRSAVEPGNGGRIYTISPRLLGSTGREHLGGNLITLLVYRRLKLMLADWLRNQQAVTGTSHDRETAHDVVSLLPDMSEDEFDFLRNDVSLRKVLDEAEAILPTCYRIRRDGQPETDTGVKASKTARFYAIWEIAEAVKLEFSRALGEEEHPGELPLEHLIRPRLKQIVAGTDFDRLPIDNLEDFPSFRTEDFVSLASPVVEQVTQLAYALTTESLNRLNQRTEKGTGESPGFTVDSIVLSGRSSQLPIFRDKLEASVRRGAPFGSNRTEILYHSRYAKLATATGALRGQRLVSLALTEPTAEEIAAGQCSRDLDIRNLFFFLPSSFKFGAQDGGFGTTLFEMHEQFRHLDFTPVGRLRTEWRTAGQEETQIFRTEGEDKSATGRLWGQMLLKELADSVGMSVDELQDGLQVQFEITHELDLYAMLRRSVPEDRKTVYAPRDASTPAECIARVPDSQWKKLMGNSAGSDTLPFPIFVGEPRSKDAVPLIDRGAKFDAVCNVGTSETPDVQPGLWSDVPLPPIKVREKAYYLFTRDPKSGTPILLAHFNLDDRSSADDARFSFEASYRLLVTADGTLALICGDEPPFWTTDDPTKWVRNEGQVLRYKLPRPEMTEDLWRDPFCGRH